MGCRPGLRVVERFGSCKGSSGSRTSEQGRTHTIIAIIVLVLIFFISRCGRSPSGRGRIAHAIAPILHRFFYLFTCRRLCSSVRQKWRCIFVSGRAKESAYLLLWLFSR